jgi:hypothetical protein
MSRLAAKVQKKLNRGQISDVVSRALARYTYVFAFFPKSGRCSTNDFSDALVEVHIKVFCVVDSNASLPHFSCDSSQNPKSHWPWLLSLPKECEGSIHGCSGEFKSASLTNMCALCAVHYIKKM